MTYNPSIYSSHRMALPDGRHIFMLYNLYTGPIYYHDRHLQRPIKDREWINDSMIVQSLLWFMHRGCKA